MRLFSRKFCEKVNSCFTFIFIFFQFLSIYDPPSASFRRFFVILNTCKVFVEFLRRKKIDVSRSTGRFATLDRFPVWSEKIFNQIPTELYCVWFYCDFFLSYPFVPGKETKKFSSNFFPVYKSSAKFRKRRFVHPWTQKIFSTCSSFAPQFCFQTFFFSFDWKTLEFGVNFWRFFLFFFRFLFSNSFTIYFWPVEEFMVRYFCFFAWPWTKMKVLQICKSVRSVKWKRDKVKEDLGLRDLGLGNLRLRDLGCCVDG